MAKKTLASDPNAFSLLSGDILGQTREALVDLSDVKSSHLRGVSLLTPNDLMARETQLHLPHFTLQYLINNWGLRKHNSVDIVGEEGVGKSSLILTLAGMFARQNTPTLILESEGKPVAENRILQCLSTDLEEAKRIRETAVDIQPVRTLQDMYIMFIRWVELVRTAGLPHHIPVVVVVDTFSKLMSNAEAAVHGLYEAKKKAAKKAARKTARKKVSASSLKLSGTDDLLSITTFEHSKFAQRLTRMLPDLLERFNAIMIFVRHQNDPKVQTGPVSIPVAKVRNDVSIGGRAIPQSSALRVVVTASELEKVGTKIIGQSVNVTLRKNNYGPGNRQIQYIVNWDAPSEEGFGQVPAVNFDYFMAEYLAENNLFGTIRNSKWEFSSRDLELANVSASAIAKAIHSDTEKYEHLLKVTGIIF
jgi:RecA/RadA recombinase